MRTIQASTAGISAIARATGSSEDAARSLCEALLDDHGSVFDMPPSKAAWDAVLATLGERMGKNAWASVGIDDTRGAALAVDPTLVDWPIWFTVASAALE